MAVPSPCSTVAAFQPWHASRRASSVSLLPGTRIVGVSITTSMSISFSSPMCIDAKSPAATTTSAPAAMSASLRAVLSSRWTSLNASRRIAARTLRRGPRDVPLRLGLDASAQVANGAARQVSERGHAMATRYRHRAAVLVQRRLRARLPDRVDEPAHGVERCARPAQHECRRVERAHRTCYALLGERDRQKKNAEARAPQRELEGLHLQHLGAEPGARVEQEHAVGTSRGRGHAALGVQPARRPAAAELVLRLTPLAIGGEGDGGQQDLLDRPLDRAQRERLLEEAVGERVVEAVERLEQAVRRPGALAALPRDLDGGRDVVRLEQRPSQRLELGELVLAVPARAAARFGIAEAALPRAQRVRTDAEKLGGRIGSNAAQRTPVVRRELHCSLKTPANYKGWQRSCS